MIVNNDACSAVLVVSIADGIVVSGYEGGEAEISCSYGHGYENYNKYLCNRSCDYSDIVIETQLGVHHSKKGSFSLHDDRKRRVFTVNVTKLTLQHAGIYWCAVSRYGKDIYTEVRLQVNSTRTSTQKRQAHLTISKKLKTVRYRRNYYSTCPHLGFKLTTSWFTAFRSSCNTTMFVSMTDFTCIPSLWTSALHNTLKKNYYIYNSDSGVTLRSKLPIWLSYHHGHLIIPSLQLAHSSPLLSPVTIPQAVAVNEIVFSVNLPGKIRIKSN
uniref:Immunoglobulin domain-containing protein n=1 Tax=Hucho hucho TaxID=62062 RepID=A0A4W5MCE5_9TELE